MVETSQRRALDEAQQKLLESERMNRSLDIELQQLKNAVESYAVRDQRRLENQKQAVDEALRDQRESFEQTSKQQLQQAQDEARRAARDAAAQIDAINFNHKANEQCTATVSMTWELCGSFLCVFRCEWRHSKHMKVK